MTNILTITLNPSIDKSTSVPFLIPDRKLRCTETKFEPGGGGINVSRAIKKLGGKSIAWFLAGGHYGNFLIDLLKQKEISYKAYSIKSETRESLILFDESKSNQFLLDMEGPVVEEKEWKGFLKSIHAIGAVDCMVASGSLPPGMPIDFFGRLAKIAKEKKAKFIVDTSGEALKIAVSEGVYIMKPNLREFGLIVGEEKMNLATCKEKANEILHKKKCEVIIVSLGAEGALLVNKEITEHISSPEIEKKSTVGAGDSMVAGVIISLSKNKTLQEAVRYGVACGAAATLNRGSALCEKADADSLYLKMEKEMKSTVHL